jgi:hypothetical protein
MSEFVQKVQVGLERVSGYVGHLVGRDVDGPLAQQSEIVEPGTQPAGVLDLCNPESFMNPESLALMRRDLRAIKNRRARALPDAMMRDPNYAKRF